MKNSKIYKALEHLSIYELNSFEKFVNSPYFNQNNRLIKYYGYLLKFLKGKVEGEINKEDIWEIIAPKEKYNYSNFRKYTSGLLKLLERFLAQQIYDKNNLNIANNLLENVSKKRMLKLYNSVLSTANRLSNRHVDRNSDFYYHQYVFEKNKFNLTSEFDKKSKKKIKYTKLNIGEMSENLDVFYISEKLKLYTTLLSWKRTYKLDIKLNFIEEVIGFVKSIDYEKFPPIAIWYQIYLTIHENENTQHYYKLKRLIETYIGSFPKDEAEDIYESALNYCISKVNSGVGEFYQEYLSLYKSMLKEEYLFEDGKLSPTRFRNIVFAATRVEEYNWAEEFIKNYSERLDENYRKNAVTFNLARLFYYRKEYSKVIEYLRNVDFDDIIYELNSKVMLITTYYDTDEIEPLYSLLDSFNVFLNRKKRTMPEQRNKRFKLFISFVKKLININPYEKNNIEKLQLEIQNAGNFSNKQWLLERVEDLSKK